MECIGGFAEGVDMTITGLPASVLGSISPERLQLAPGNSATATLTLSSTNLSGIHGGGLPPSASTISGTLGLHEQPRPALTL
jgi:hypothetical protein